MVKGDRGFTDPSHQPPAKIAATRHESAENGRRRARSTGKPVLVELVGERADDGDAGRRSCA
jgi:hypothetical protein